MLKALVFVSLMVAPALADPQGTHTPPPNAPSIQIKLAVADGKDVRAYTVGLVENTCGEAGQLKNDVRDSIRLCAYADGTDVRLSVKWNLKEKDREIQNESELVLAHKGSHTLDGGSAKLTVSML
ncbi:MAG: hypothetical protein QM831_17315 [Kofleriaceae bacterium]